MSLSVEVFTAAAFLLTVAGLIFKAGRTETKIREAQVQSKKDIDGIGSKTRKMVAEEIILASVVCFGKYDANFAFTVRRLLG